MSKNVIEVTETTFDDIVNDKIDFVIADFWAPWCGPCRMMSPVFEEIAGEIGSDKVKFIKINVDEDPNLGSKFRVTSIPFFVIFKKGKVLTTKVGGSTKNAMLEWIQSNIK